MRQDISYINFTTTSIRMIFEGKIKGRASGFFYRSGNDKYLITNRHVVFDAEDDFYPESLILKLHLSRTELELNVDVQISLYDANNNKLWLEHKRFNELKCDVVAIPLTQATMTQEYFNLFNRSSLTFFAQELMDIPAVNPFGDVVVVGYPLGFFDEVNNLPVYRKAMIASHFGVDFENRPYFLIDANLHKGTSGSPVVNSHHTLFKEKGFNEGYKLFGIHSAEHLMEGEPLGLNVVWYSTILEEIIKGNKKT
ncbi:MAG: hypothetical protein SCARUB_00448 [Candidatus Scalindua rubra]|uniref:Uncharacterized protein n=1 Tax=Candidatus Scalindua rubra TaxID=1872076 RepID=A0A1E3XFM1_9BACT|nr:MAG: hypothetical protein SCARUB_00448 [Candidatus Scalindua rubra]